MTADQDRRVSYACDPARSIGRAYPEAPSGTRTPFARDRDRVIHTSAFRRLKERKRQTNGPAASEETLS